MGGQQLLESQGAKKNGKSLPRTHIWNSVLSLLMGFFFSFSFVCFIFFVVVFLRFKKIQTTDCMTAGIFLTIFFPLGSKGMGFAVQNLKECNTNTVCSLERKLFTLYALIPHFWELWTIGLFLKGHLRQSNAEGWVQYLTTTLKKHGTKLKKKKGKWFWFFKTKFRI